MRFQPGAQVQIPPIHAISHDPGKRNPCFPQALDHLSGQFTFRLKTNRLGNASLYAPRRIVDPFLGKVEFAVDEGMSFCAYVAETRRRPDSSRASPVVPQYCFFTPADFFP